MRGMSYIWRMALRRKAACLLVVVSTMVATVFMLFYPSLIENTKQRLEDTYNSIEVTGSIATREYLLTTAVSDSIWAELQGSGWFSELYGSSDFSVDTFSKAMVEQEAGADANEQTKLRAFQDLLLNEDENSRLGGRMTAYSTFEAADELVRIREDISWLDGYDESCLEGDERVCLVPESWGYELGDTIPLLARTTIPSYGDIEGIFRIKVVATYPGKITSVSAAMPLKTLKALTEDASVAQKQHGNHYAWSFGLKEVYFTVKDNQKLDEIKAMLMQFRDSETVRVRIDDKVLKETVNPIESNLSQMEGSFLFFFVMIAAIGFFISFLLARGRKSEYAVMRLLGESRARVTMKALVEQFIFCLVGVAFGALIDIKSFDLTICGVILLCYTLGAALAVVLTVEVNVMDILRDKE